jgi:hypothetical protein
LVIAGALVAVAGMIKQPFFAMFAPLAWEVWHSRNRLVDAVAALTGTVLTVIVVGLPFGLPAVWKWAWVDTGDYLWGQLDIVHILEMLALVLALFSILHLPTLSSIWTRRSRLGSVDPIVWCWLAGAVIAIVPGFRFIAHYFQLVVPPLAVLAGLVLSADATDLSATDHARAGRDIRRVLIVSAALTMTCTLMATAKVADAAQVRPNLVAAIKARTATTDRILVWGALPETYWRAGRLPAQPFLSVGYLTGKWADRPHPPLDVENVEPFRSRWIVFDQDLRLHPPALVVDTSTSGLDGWNVYSPANYRFGQVLERCYHRDGQVEHMTLWTLDDRACVERAAR